MRNKLEAVLNDIRPSLQADGGDLQLVDVNDGVVTVRLLGACSGCPMANMTFQQAIERRLKEEVPEVKKVVST